MSRIPPGTTRRGPYRSVIEPETSHDAGRADALGCHEQTGRQRALAAGDLVVERQQEHRPVQGGPSTKTQMLADREVAVLEQAQIEQGVLDPEGVDHEADHQPHAQHEARDDGHAGELAGHAHFGEGVDQGRQAGAQEAEAEGVEAGTYLLLLATLARKREESRSVTMPMGTLI